MTARKDEFEESPLRSEMQALLERVEGFPESSARRHHFVPAFALAQFARPPERKGWLFQLDVRTGRPQRTRPHDVAYEENFYTYTNTEGAPSNTVEAFFAVVEKHAAGALQQLRENPLELTPQQRESIAYFLVFQESRTPAGLARSERIRQASLEIRAGLDIGSPEGFRRKYAEAMTANESEDDFEAVRLRMQRQLLDGDVGFDQPRVGALHQIIDGAHDLAQTIYDLDWTVLTATDAEFVTSDRPVSMVDHTPEHPWSGNAWTSSPGAISFYPLSPSLGLFITPGDPSIGTATSNAEQVRRLNLMTYGWADRYIFGASQETVSLVRRQAKKHPAEVVRRRSNKQVLLFPADMQDPAVTADYARRGWPTQIRVRGDDGQVRVCGYLVIDLDDPAGTAAHAATSIAEKFKTSTGDGDPPARAAV